MVEFETLLWFFVISTEDSALPAIYDLENLMTIAKNNQFVEIACYNGLLLYLLKTLVDFFYNSRNCRVWATSPIFYAIGRSIKSTSCDNDSAWPLFYQQIVRYGFDIQHKIFDKDAPLWPCSSRKIEYEGGRENV